MNDGSDENLFNEEEDSDSDEFQGESPYLWMSFYSFLSSSHYKFKSSGDVRFGSNPKCLKLWNKKIGNDI